jgi:hypothetical protein
MPSEPRLELPEMEPAPAKPPPQAGADADLPTALPARPPEAPEEDDYGEPRRRRRRAYDDDSNFDDDFDDEYRATPRRRGSHTGLIVGLVAGGVGLLVVVGGLIAVAVIVVNRMNRPEAPGRRQTILSRGNAPSGVNIVPPRAPEVIPDDEWQPLTVPEADFSVLMPGPPVPMLILSQDMQHFSGKKYYLQLPFYQKEFTVGYNDLPAKFVAKKEFRTLAAPERDALVRLNGGTGVVERNIKLGKYAGWQIEMDSAQKGHVIERLYLVQRGTAYRSYFAMAAGPGMRTDKGDGAKFFGSFKITGDGTKGQK